MGLIFLAFKPWAAGIGVGLGLLAPEIPSRIFIHHMWVWDQPVLCPSLLPVWMDVVSLIP